MTPLTDAELDRLCENLGDWLPQESICQCAPVIAEAAAAIRSLRTERDALKRDYGLLLELASDFERERDALRIERDALRADLTRLKQYVRHDDDCNIHSEYGTGGFCDCGLGPNLDAVLAGADPRSIDSAMQGEQQK